MLLHCRQLGRPAQTFSGCGVARESNAGFVFVGPWDNQNLK
jgi:hypothetical protein